MVCGRSDQARIRRQFGTFDYPSNQFGNQFFPNQGPQNQFGGPGGVLFPGQNGQNGFNQGFQGNGQQGQNGFNQNGNQNGFNQGFQGNGQQGQNGNQNGNQGFQGNGQQRPGPQTTAAPSATVPPTTLAPQLQRCVDGCIGEPPCSKESKSSDGFAGETRGANLHLPFQGSQQINIIQSAELTCRPIITKKDLTALGSAVSVSSN